MIKLDTSVSAVPKVGPKYKKLLEKLGIFTVNDLLFHFPYRYDDFSKVVKISELSEGETVSVKGVLGKVTNIYTKFGKRLTKSSLSDSSGETDIVWFNQHFLKKVLKPGSNYILSGKPVLFSGKLVLMSPEIEELNESSLHTGRMVPIYPETAGVSSKWLRTRINDVVSRQESKGFLQEYIPEHLLEKYQFNNLHASLKKIHFPLNQDDADSSRNRFAFEEFFFELLNVEQRKLEWQSRFEGYPLKKYEKQVNQFIENLSFKLTPSQEKSLSEIISDLQKTTAMNRLLEGDVGTGKTIVALICAYLVHLNGFRTLYMAPTELLAKQHYETFCTYLSPVNVSIKLKTSSFKSERDTGDIIIGTHALLFNQQRYSDIGLVVIDEQHRFGVEQRGKIIELGKGEKVPNILTMTATPIPRTLALTLYGDLDISFLDTQPGKIRKVTTKVVPEKARGDTYRWINTLNVQVFIVCPLIDPSESDSLQNVKSAEEEFKYLQNEIFAGKNVGLLHGRMKQTDKYSVVDKFRNKELDVLVSTPVIEVGIDIPEASIMVIESSERYGLASLHQLRGRVGRAGQAGYCFLMLSNYSQQAYTRLKHLENIDNGLRLAEIDMRLRGQGNIFSTLQHGFKRFKLARFDDLEMLENAKSEASKIYCELDKYPLLKDRAELINGKYVKNN